ncbi:flagellar brake protein [Pseudobdellovibrio exovorus]|uniref:Hemolysin n=1 Tax=Pseudobdellovibrio exovorus JSS TaxID=1184267 RepID=M4VAM0_9BACT|nr:PilZ domain-containing protein [Pseudobdellovibrio exovorus]AGH96278.1 hemolysin [Pseudobdellovibrio exovorus JSS]
MSQESFFNKISSSAFSEIIKSISEHQTELILKVRDQYAKSEIKSVRSSGFILPSLGTNQILDEKVTVCFHLNDELYFFVSAINNEEAECQIKKPEHIFQLQRRNNYRVSMPLGVKYTCRLKKINLEPLKKEATLEIRDISLGGCQVFFESASGESLLKQNDKFEIYLKLDRFEFAALQLIARHIKPLEDNGFLVGCSFEEVNAEVLSEVQALLMFLDRFHRGRNS